MHIPLEHRPMRVTAHRYYLHMQSRSQWRPVQTIPEGVCVQKVEVLCPEFSRFLYTAVGGDWYWIDRLNWTYDQWMNLLEDTHFHTWVLYKQGTPAGYFELHQSERGVEIASFGLIRSFQRKGLGSYFISKAIECAWDLRPRRVWLHTCELDHPHALDNYQKRGFVIFEDGECQYDLPPQPVGPWMGCQLETHPDQRFG